MRFAPNPTRRRSRVRSSGTGTGTGTGTSVGVGMGTGVDKRASRRTLVLRCALPMLLASTAAMLTSAASALATAGTPAKPIAAPSSVRGYPLVLARGSQGEVWYGGATNEAGCSGTSSCPADYVERADEIGPTGLISDFGFPASLSERFPGYFAAGSAGAEWFLAYKNAEPTPQLGEVTAFGTFAVSRLGVDPHTLVRGLAMGAEGDLWSTATRRRGRVWNGAILRITPAGLVTRYTRGLLTGARPANIVAGPHGEMWFTDAAGRIGRISASGAIDELSLGRAITSARPIFEPSRPIVLAGGRVWCIVGANTIARMSRDGRVRFFHPRSSYHGAEAAPQAGELVGLAAAPRGEVWFTRESGEVGRIEASGRARTITNRLVNAYGIAFGLGGIAWVGEGPGFTLGLDVREGELPARVARIKPRGAVTQYPPLAACRVPRLIGLERVFTEGALFDEKRPACNRVKVGHVTVRRRAGNGHGRLIVVSQSPRAGTPFVGYRDVQITLAPAPPPPRGCRPPAYYSLIADGPQLIAWKVKQASGEQGEEFTETYYACSPPHGRKRVLASAYAALTCGGIASDLRFAGDYAALIASSGCQYGSVTTVRVLDVRSGRVASTVVAEPDEGELSEGPTDLQHLGSPVGVGAESLALDDRGDVAWIGDTATRRGGPPAQKVLYIRDSQGVRRLAVAPTITGFAFSGEQLVWREGDAARAAPR